MSRLAIQACGMTTAIGLTGPAAAAAQRARLSRFEETHFISRDGKWMIGAEVPLDPPKRGRARLQALLAGPLRECFAALGDVNPKDVPVLLCVAEADRPGRLARLDTSLLHDTLTAIGQPIHDSSAVITYGRVGGVVALRDARDLINKGAPKVIIAGVDSYLLAGTLAHYDHDDRVLTEANREEAHITSGEPFRADGLVKAMRDALGEAGLDFSDVDYRISDLNGEQYYFKEAALAMTRVLRKRRDQMDLWNPASEFGYTGAASMPLMLGVGLTAAQKHYAPGPTVIMQTSDDDGRRGTAIFRMEG